MPAWSDLTGVGNDAYSSRSNPPSELNPLPQRRASENWPSEDGTDGRRQEVAGGSPGSS